MWHDVLDRTLISFSIWWLTCPHHRPRAANVRPASSPRTTSLGPLRSVRIRSARSSSGVCPECGTNVQKHVRNADVSAGILQCADVDVGVPNASLNAKVPGQHPDRQRSHQRDKYDGNNMVLLQS